MDGKITKNANKLLIMLLVIIFGLFFLSFNPTSSKAKTIQEYLTTKRTILLDTLLKDRMRIVPYCTDNKVFVFYDIFFETDSIDYYKLFEYSDSTYEYTIFLDKNLTSERIWYTSISIENDLLFLHSPQEVLVFKRFGLTYNFQRRITLPANCSDFEIQDSIMIGYNTNLSYNRTETDSSTYLIKFNLDNSKIETRYFKRPSGLEWTFIRPRKLMDIFDNKLLISSADEYSIKEYDLVENNDNPLIITGELNYIESDSISNPKSRVDFTKLIEKMKKSNLIRYVNYLTPNDILVCISHPPIDELKNYSLTFDVWSRVDGTWVLKNKGLINNMFKESELYSPDKEMLDAYIISDGLLLSIIPLPFEISSIRYSHEKIREMSNDYFYKNGLRYSLVIMSLK